MTYETVGRGALGAARLGMAGLAAAVVVCAAQAAQAAITVDQVNLAPTPQPTLQGSGVHDTWRQVQTVTASLDGVLAQVDLQMYSTGDVGTFRFSLYDGDYAQAPSTLPGSPGGFGTLIGSFSISTASMPSLPGFRSGDLVSFDVSGLHYHVAPGQVFSLLSEVVTPQGLVGWASGYLTDPADPSSLVGLNYDRGYNSATFFGDTTFVRTQVDRGFRTWVDIAPAPEPGAWALMILGLALSGVGLRSRRGRAAHLAAGG